MEKKKEGKVLQQQAKHTAPKKDAVKNTPRKPAAKQPETFVNQLTGKSVIITFRDNTTITGHISYVSPYEILMDDGTVIMKSGVRSIIKLSDTIDKEKVKGVKGGPLMTLLNEQVKVIMTDGTDYQGVFRRFSRYEIEVEHNNMLALIMKHDIASMKKQDN